MACSWAAVIFSACSELESNRLRGHCAKHQGPCVFIRRVPYCVCCKNFCILSFCNCLKSTQVVMRSRLCCSARSAPGARCSVKNCLISSRFSREQNPPSAETAPLPPKVVTFSANEYQI